MSYVSHVFSAPLLLPTGPLPHLTHLYHLSHLTLCSGSCALWEPMTDDRHIGMGEVQRMLEGIEGCVEGSLKVSEMPVEVGLVWP